MGYFARNVVVQSLQAERHVSVFGDLPIAAVEVVLEQICLDLRGQPTEFGMFVAVKNVRFCSSMIRRGK